jgi:hypothetical protein
LIEFMSRASTGAATSFLAGGTEAIPAWLRLTRSGTTINGEVSADGVTWTLVGSTSTALAATGSIGLVVTSHDPTQRDTATFGNVVVTLPPSKSTDIVLYATDSSNAHGNWARVADPTAAGGQTLASIDKGVANTAGALATPIDYVEFTFSDAIDKSGAAFSAIGTTDALTVGLATDASGNSLSGWGWQDGAYWLTQPTTFAFAGGTHTLRIQTREDGVSIDQVVFSPVTFLTSAPGPASNDVTIVPKPGTSVSQPPTAPRLPTPADTATGVALSTQLTWSAAGATSYDVGFGTVTPPPHAATGLTSAAYTPSAMMNGTTYFWQVTAHNASGTSLGPVWSFTTVAVATVTPPAPATYNTISDRTTLVKPALPALGAAGSTFVDPTFGTKMARVTDGQTRPGSVNRSYREPSNAHLTAWNVNSTLFYVISNDGTTIPYAFNPATMAMSRLQPGPAPEGGFVLTFYTSVSYPGDGGLTLKFYVEPQFSRVDPNIIFGAMQGSNNLTISAYNFEAGTYTTLIDLSTIVSGLSGTFIGGLVSGGTPTENLMTFFGGASQDSHFYALWTPVANLGARKLINTLASTINGVATNTPLNFHLHSAMIDKGGRFVFLYPTAVDLASPRNASQVYVWDTSTDTVTAITSGGKDGGVNMHPGGHDAAGYGTWVNQDCCTSSTYDAAQWQFRYLTAVSQTSDLISPVMAAKEVYLADHTTWNNAQPTTLVPVISSLYRYGANTTPWRAWDDEIIGIDTANGGGGLVWRFAHHRSLVASDNNPISPYFWYEPIANVSPDGQFVLFTSNWEKSLGTDASNDSGGAGTFRQDVFVVQLVRQP